MRLILFLLLALVAGTVAAPTRSSTAVAEACSPSVAIDVGVLEREGAEVVALTVTVRATAPISGGDALTHVRFVDVANGTIEADGVFGSVHGAVTFDPPVPAWSFVLRKAGRGAAFQSTLVATDRCGDVQKFVGAGTGGVPAMPTPSPIPSGGVPTSPPPTGGEIIPTSRTSAGVAAAIAAAPTGGTVYLPAGTWDFTDRGAKITRGAVTIRGDGDATVIRAASHGGFYVDAPSQVAGVRVTALKIVGDGTGQYASGVWMGRCDDCRVDRVTVQDVGVSDSPDSHCVHLRDGARAIVADNHLVRCGGAGVQLWRQSNSRIERNVATDNGRHGVQLIGASSGNTVVDNTLVGNGREPNGEGREGRAGLLLNDDGVSFPQTALIQGNTVTGSGDHGIALFDWRSNRPLPDGVLDVRVVGNTVTDHRNWSRGSAGLIAEGVGRALFERNRSDRNRFGLHAWNTGPGLIFRDNVAIDNAVTGIYLAAAKGFVLERNEIRQAPTTGWALDCTDAPGSFDSISRDGRIDGNTLMNGARAAQLKAGRCVGMTIVRDRVSAAIEDQNPLGVNTLDDNLVVGL